MEAGGAWNVSPPAVGVSTKLILYENPCVQAEAISGDRSVQPRFI